MSSRAKYITIGTKPLPVAERPKCMFCGKPLQPNYTIDFDKHTDLMAPYERTFTGTYGCTYQSLFCQPRHGLLWAEKTIARIRSGEIAVIHRKRVKE